MTEIVRCRNLLSVDYYIRTGLMMWCVNRTSNFLPMLVTTSDVKSSRPKSRPKWPRGQNFGLGLGLEALAFGLGLASISLSYYNNRAFFGQKSCKIRQFCLIIIWHFFIIYYF